MHLHIAYDSSLAFAFQCARAAFEHKHAVHTTSKGKGATPGGEQTAMEGYSTSINSCHLRLV